MRTDLIEPASKSLSARARRDVARPSIALEPLAVDAAMEDETLPVVTERGSRRDPGSRSLRAKGPTNNEDASDAALLESLSEQLELLHEQQRQIRLLLDRAGHVRLDAANV